MTLERPQVGGFYTLRLREPEHKVLPTCETCDRHDPFDHELAAKISGRIVRVVADLSGYETSALCTDCGKRQTVRLPEGYYFVVAVDGEPLDEKSPDDDGLAVAYTELEPLARRPDGRIDWRKEMEREGYG